MADEQIPPGVKVIGRIPAPGGGEWVLGDDGGVFAINGAPFFGSYHGLDPEQRQGQRNITGIEGTQEGGYKLNSDNPGDAGYTFNPGSTMGFGQTSQNTAAPDPLAGDPAYQAFVRTSGMALEIAAANTARRRQAIDMALGLEIPEREEQGQRQRSGINSDFESRGLFRSGERTSKLGEQESDQAADIARRRLAALEETQGLESSLSEQVAGTQRQGAELGASLLGNRYGDQQQQELKKMTGKYEDDLAALRRQIQSYGG